MRRQLERLMRHLTPRRVLVVAALFLSVVLGGCAGKLNDLLLYFEPATPSRAYGTPAKGWLAHGKRMPSQGANFEAYSGLAALMGRAQLHSVGRSALLDAYALLARSQPEHRFIYGELGWSKGGPFTPHRTHQNGLSLDLMVPMRRLDNNQAQPLSCSAFNAFCYKIELDPQGHAHGLRIDFEALADMIQAIDKTAREHGAQIALIIFDPKLRPQLFKANPKLKALPWLKRAAWVRHDEHIHIDLRLLSPATKKSSL